MRRQNEDKGTLNLTLMRSNFSTQHCCYVATATADALAEKYETVKCWTMNINSHSALMLWMGDTGWLVARNCVCMLLLLQINGSDDFSLKHSNKIEAGNNITGFTSNKLIQFTHSDEMTRSLEYALCVTLLSVSHRTPCAPHIVSWLLHITICYCRRRRRCRRCLTLKTEQTVSYDTVR